MKILSVSVVKVTLENIHHRGTEIAPRHREELFTERLQKVHCTGGNASVI
jgi:hypothetical protein